MPELIEPGPYTYHLTIEHPIELDPPKDWAADPAKYGKTTSRIVGGEIKVTTPEPEDKIREWLVNRHCTDLIGHSVTITHFSLKAGRRGR